MKVELLTKVNYNNFDNKMDELFNEYSLDVNTEKFKDEIRDIVKKLEIDRRSEIVAAAGNLSRNSGSVFDVLEKKEKLPLESNSNFASKVIGMGHTSISELDFCVFALNNVSALVEQTIIEERYSAFCIKSRREVDFSKVGYFIPQFRDKSGNVHPQNDFLNQKYKSHMDNLFNKYYELLNLGISKEDARFVLPYCYNSNIFMGIDAHTLRDLIIKCTKTKYSKIQELKEFGEKLYDIAVENIPYIVPSIDQVEYREDDLVDELLKDKVNFCDYNILAKPKLLNATDNIDAVICTSAIMKRYQVEYDKARKIYDELIKEDLDFSSKLIKNITFKGDQLELTQVNFRFQIPISFAVLTHLTRHRQHDLIIPDFVPIVDLTQYKIPPKIERTCLEFYKSIYDDNINMYNLFIKNGVREEDLVYFTLSGNMVNVLTDINGKNVQHILSLRECTKAQWEIRKIANDIHEEIEKLPNSTAFCKVLGPACVTKRICPEGKESCGKILTLNKK